MIYGALLWMADKLTSDQAERARAMWTAKGKQAFGVESATDRSVMFAESGMTDGGRCGDLKNRSAARHRVHIAASSSCLDDGRDRRPGWP